MLKEKNTAICLSEETNLNTFGIIAESIAELINSSTVEDVKVVTVNVLPISSYKIGADEKLNGDIIIRGINPDARTGVVELLEPNILTGISAAGKKQKKITSRMESWLFLAQNRNQIWLIVECDFHTS